MGKNVVVIGTQWGDEGKGKIVDLLTDRASAVVRFQGGHNAGHTLVIDGEKTVLHLIDHVAESGLTFIRNNDSYTAAEAARHMNKKYQHFRKDINTAEDFIERCASRSLLSGKAYLVINEQNEHVRTSEWLELELADYRERNTETTQ